MISIGQLAILCLALLISAGLSATTIYVDDNAPNDPGPGDPAVSDPLEDGSSGHPYDAIQEGIDAAADGFDDITVKDGTYTGVGNRDIEFDGKAIVLESENGADVTIIDCENSGRGFAFDDGETATSVVDGFTIMNGFASGDWPDNCGGGIYCNGSSPTITNCTISGNSVMGDWCYGGGIYCYDSNPTITNCTISGNTALYYGGGIFCNDSDPTITNCTISDNSADYSGGIYCYDSNPIIINCTISDNSADYGGGIYANRSDPTITNCTISGNSANSDGGGIYCKDHSNPTITNCTISGNSADYGGGIYCRDNSSPTMTDCILWVNEAGNGHEIALAWTSTLTVRYSDVQGGVIDAYVELGCTLDLDGTNINTDPLFVSGPLGDYYLSHVAAGQPLNSPCVDTGSDTAANLSFNTSTTRSDSVPDAGTVDIGYHAPSAIWINSITRSGNNITIEWNASAGVSYVVEWSTDCEFGSCTGVSVGTTDTWTDVVGALQLQRYYSVRIQ